MASDADSTHRPYDVLIVGGGPAGLSAALALGRACKRVLLCDAGPRRNAAAEHMHNFLTRDGTPPAELRRIAREQLQTYPNVEIRDAGVQAIKGARGSFEISLDDAPRIHARRVILCMGMVDQMIPIDGFRELWGHSIVQCPYCHGWELRDRRWGYFARSAEMLHFPVFLRGWTRDVTVFTHGAFDVPDDARARLAAANVRLETQPIVRLEAHERSLRGAVLANGETRACDVLFVHPPQTQIDLVRALGLTLDEHGFVQVDPMSRETSIPGIYAGGDLATRMQSAMFAATAGAQAAAMLNHELTVELAAAGAL